MNGYKLVSDHMGRVSLLAERTAKESGEDPEEAFFCGRTHDIGKLVLSSSLFDGHSISSGEYELAKQHVFRGFEMLKDIDISLAFCAGFHHKFGRFGYGITLRELPQGWSLETKRKEFRIALIVAVCDYIDAFQKRKTKIMDGSDRKHMDGLKRKHRDLKRMLEEKYFYLGSRQIIEAALRANKELNL